MGWFNDLFGSGAEDYNKNLDQAWRGALQNELTTNAIGQSFNDFQDMYRATLDPALATLAQGAQVGANMDTQAIQANMARQGLGGSGLGAALGAGLRTGATLAVGQQQNALRLRMAQEAMGQAVGLRRARAGITMEGALGRQLEPGLGREMLQMAGSVAQTAGLFTGIQTPSGGSDLAQPGHLGLA